MELEIQPLRDVPSDLVAVDVVADGSSIGVGGSTDARDLSFGGHVVHTGLRCRFPLVCGLDRETAVLVDARTSGHPNAWVIHADGTHGAEFSVGDAVQGITSVGGWFVVTHFDEGLGNDLHGALAFDRTGRLQMHYRRDVAGACDIVDCYAAAPVGNESVLLLIYPDFLLAEVNLVARTQQVWHTPDVVHGARALSARGREICFHGRYGDRTAVHRWQRGDTHASRIASFDAPLRGLRGGWFLAQQDDGYSLVRFSTSDAAA